MMEKTFELSTNPLGQLVLIRPGEADVADVRLRRSFPWTHPDDYISVRNSDGKEVALIDHLADLTPAERGHVERWLGDASFIPAIRRVESVNTDFGYQIWIVDTDRGPATFRVQEREDIRFLPDGRFSLKDVEGNVYVMSRIDALDEQSRRAVEAIL